ncbi:Uu.00g022970.m01.CDS01 [Anthostomella pinea]|uniref:Uu.00g022970.m01.CDS01 n=1 Tax=Anthostomella pinea TaxID=933095 RepID=A0AAI8YQZ0_9PEZI|nr:Uu.00g022970.m01.CDS01 [Anthostomella pinea]
MAQDQTEHEARDDEPTISPVESSNHPIHSTRDNATAPTPATSSSQPQQADMDDGEAAPPLPKRPARAVDQQQPLPPPHHQHQQQHQMPYAPYPYPPQQQQQPYPYAQPMRPLPRMSQPYIATKLGLTVLSSVVAIIIIALASTFLSENGDANAISYYAFPIAAAAIIWNTAELITYCVRLRKHAQRGIHPGAHVGLHLCFWIACVFAVLLTVSIYYSENSTIQDCENPSDDEDGGGYYGSSYHRSSYSSYCDEYQPADYYKWIYLPTLRALIAMFALATIIHFVLFVLACIDTHKRNLLKHAGVAMPYPTAAAPAPGMYYAAAPPPGMVPMQYYQYAPMPPPQQAHMAPGSAPAPGAPAPQPQDPKGKETAQSYQNLAGFYAPAPVPAPVSPATRQMEQRSAPGQASSSDEKVTPAEPAQTAGPA